MDDRLYGFRSDNIYFIKSSLENFLGFRFVTHDSLYQGGTYFRYSPSDTESFILRRNIDLIDNEPAESDFAEFPVLLYHKGVNSSDKVGDLVDQASLECALLRW